MRKRYARILAPTALLMLTILPTGPAWAADDDLGLYLKADEMVESTSHYPIPMNQVAENVTIITADEIEAQHAHTVYEVLSQIPGLYMIGYGQDVGSMADMRIQGSESRHTLVLVDGIRLNDASAGEAFINGLPLGIIKRIEIIKGPASSAWGSSLGGVVNILTKETGKSERPNGQVTASLGEKGTSDSSAQVAGQAGPLGYYLFAGNQESNGHWRDCWFDNQPLYAKLTLPLSRITLGATIGTSTPSNKIIETPSSDLSDYIQNRSTFTTTYLDAGLDHGFNLHLDFSRFDQTFDRQDFSLGLGTTVDAHTWASGELLTSDTFQEKNETFSGQLSWSGQAHSAVLGFESGRGNLNYSGNWPLWERFGFPSVPYDAQEKRQAVFASTNLNWGRLTLSPGGRYDSSSASGEAFSPSLGAVWRFDADTLLRATAARGFNSPHLTYLFNPLDGNPDLKPELVTSFQLGVESVAVPALHLSASVFHHRITDIISAPVWQQENEGVRRLNGLELEADTTPWHRLTFGAKASLVSTDSAEKENDTTYAANLTARYDHPELLSVRLGGRYIWYIQEDRRPGSKLDTFIWDLALSRELYRSETLKAELFGVAHNLFNGAQYWLYDYHNPARWLEAGVTVKF